MRSTDLSPGGLDGLGEHVMNRMVGSPARHEDLDARMTAVMGPRAEERMHELTGARWAGCAAADGADVAGPGMMGAGTAGATPWASMMDSATWGWMREGRWERMRRDDWARLGDRWMGPGMMSGTGGWSVAEFALVVLGGLAAAAAIAVGATLVARRRRGGDRPSQPRPPGAPAP